MLLQILLAAARRGEPIHLAALLLREGSAQQRDRARLLVWRLRYQGHYWAIVLLCWWAYLDPTLPSLLRPSGLDPAPMRIYNFMHYGQAGGLSAMLAVTILAPLLLVGCLSLLRRILLPLLDRGIRRLRDTSR
jgi:ABC-type Fe3+ transport system permease subunit